MALPRLWTRMAEVGWVGSKLEYGSGRPDEPWACIEHYPKVKVPYYWWAKRPGSESVDGWETTLEDAQRKAEDWMFPDDTRTT